MRRGRRAALICPVPACMHARTDNIAWWKPDRWGFRERRETNGQEGVGRPRRRLFFSQQLSLFYSPLPRFPGHKEAHRLAGQAAAQPHLPQWGTVLRPQRAAVSDFLAPLCASNDRKQLHSASSWWATVEKYYTQSNLAPPSPHPQLPDPRRGGLAGKIAEEREHHSEFTG
ncbi:hypothetical protein AXF42_Ash010127 [Apostasia shenzhenica]|uniref:Uncharacterized protein n=1 Tax=Apostasia shenzhenica TaxID=1088818 RepID=A0A2I0A9M8_9ASPA|nr:hypothetical protein AXF42_Ash010127 [Apostasia shenzhenica]